MKRLLLKIKKLLGRIMVQNNDAEEINYLGRIDRKWIDIDPDSISFDAAKSVTNSKSFN